MEPIKYITGRLIAYEKKYGNGDGKLDAGEENAITVFKKNMTALYERGALFQENYDAAMKIDAASIMGLELTEENVGKVINAPADATPKAVTNPITTSNSSTASPDATDLTVIETAVTDKNETEPTQKGGTPAEQRFLARREEVSHIGAEELNNTKLIHGVTVMDLLQYDFLNKDLAENKDGALEKALRERYPNASDAWLAEQLKSEMAIRAKRFNADGTFNLSEIADGMNDVLGTELTKNQSNNKYISESNAARSSHFLGLICPNGIDEFYDSANIRKKVSARERKTDKMANNLVKFFAGKVEGNEHKIANMFKKDLKDDLPIIAGTGAIPWFLPENKVLVQQFQRVVNGHAQHFTSEELNRIFQELAGATTAAEQETILTRLFGAQGMENIYQYQRVTLDSRLINSLANIATGLGIAVLTAVLKDLIIGEEHQFEKAVINLNPFGADDPEYSNLEAFKNTVDADDALFPPGTKETIKLIAEQFVYKVCTGQKNEKGEWIYEEIFDYQSMYDFLRECAGKGSGVMNRNEFMTALATEKGQNALNKYLAVMKKKEKECCPETTPPTQEPPTDPNQNNDSGELYMVTVNYEKETEDGIVCGGWRGLANAYTECFDAFFKNGGTLILGNNRDLTERRIIKILQGINDANYSFDRINTILQMIKKGTLNKKNSPEWFDYDAYYSALQGYAGRETVMPTYILYDYDKKIYELTDAERATLCPKGACKKPPKSKNNNNKSNNSGGNSKTLRAANSANVSGSETHYYYRKSGGQWTETSGTDYSHREKSGNYKKVDHM